VRLTLISCFLSLSFVCEEALTLGVLIDIESTKRQRKTLKHAASCVVITLRSKLTLSTSISTCMFSSDILTSLFSLYSRHK
jgi:hypothetical protein